MDKLNWGTMACAVFVLCVAAAMSLPAQTFNTLHSFDYTDGAQPFAGLLQATDGNLYGTTLGGGANGNYGTVFQITTTGTLTTLYNFCLLSGCTDGAGPTALVQGTDGNFYGTTQGGGANGEGTVFKITPSGNLTTLYSFCSQSGCTDGIIPNAGLVLASDGNLYGTTSGGGVHGNYGTVFQITTTGTLFKTLYSFCSQSNCKDGWNPEAALVQATDGKLYGTTVGGGVNGNYGTVFQITTTGTLFKTLYNFCSKPNCKDGQQPAAGLVQATDGNFYGTTSGGGVHGNYGTVFQITPTGTLNTLYSFCSQSNCKDGWNPEAALVQATDGNFYGTTLDGGAPDGGTVFKLTGSTLTTLHSFDGTNGSRPFAGLVQATDGNFYGTTYVGGPYGWGTVFSLDAGLGPVVSLSPTTLTFGPQGVSAPNVPQVVTLTNTGELPLSITGITVTGQNSGDFAQVNNCPISPNTLAAGDSCMITVYFFPVGAGTLAAAVTVTDNAPGSPQNVPLSGVGVSGKPGLAGPTGQRQTAEPGRP
ncbi:MAG TPA: choice-of-anchor tandem repeat GloVer-containing protein [Terriglobia bacterium]|nr:choice-of-anchor tandem repeat GloVer-containing protein [Terriglobia bacterium]